MPASLLSTLRIKNMSKTISVSLVAAMFAFFAFGVSQAFAASISNPLFSNGQTEIDATGGSTVSGTFTLTVGAGEVCEVLRTQSDPSQPFTDTSVGGQLGYQEQVYIGVPFSVKAPPNTGTYFPTVQCAGAFGGSRAINGGDTVAPSTISLPSTGLGTVRVVASGSSSSSSGSTGFFGWTFDDLMKKIEQLTSQLICVQTEGMQWNDSVKACVSKPVPPAPAKPAYCAGLAGYQYLSYGMTGPTVSTFQNFLMANGFSIAAGATGNYFDQTASANAKANLACQ